MFRPPAMFRETYPFGLNGMSPVQPMSVPDSIVEEEVATVHQCVSAPSGMSKRAFSRRSPGRFTSRVRSFSEDTIHPDVTKIFDSTGGVLRVT